jgi:uncharacterized membrane protein (DUF106 family)
VENLLVQLSGAKEKLVVKASVQEIVADKIEQTLIDYINKIKEHQVTMKLEELDKKIEQAENEGDNQKVNQLLVEYQRLLGKEGNNN